MPEWTRRGRSTDRGRRGPNASAKTARTDLRVDSEIIFKIKQHLRKVHRIPANRIKTEHAVRIYKDGYVVLKPTRYGRTPRSRGLVHAPDIIVLNDEDGIWFVIEQDGRIHESDKVAKRDEERNRHYAAAGIPYIVMSTRAIRSEGVSAAEYLDREMEFVLAASSRGDPAPKSSARITPSP